MNLTILGDEAEITASIKRLGLTLDTTSITIINPATSENYNSYSETLYELRKTKNVTLDMARDLMLDVSYFGTMMVYKGMPMEWFRAPCIRLSIPFDLRFNSSKQNRASRWFRQYFLCACPTAYRSSATVP